METAALRPAPMARMTVALPKTKTPPAKTPGSAAHGFRIGNDVIPFVGLRKLGVPFGRGVGGLAGADADDGYVGGQNVFRAGDGYGATTAIGSRLAKLHGDTACAGKPAFFVAKKLDGIGKHAEFDAFRDGVVDFFSACGQFNLGTAID